MAAHEKWMPLYVGDYLADTMHLTARQHGAYLLLLMHSWRSGGKIPTDPAQQAAIARSTVVEWEADKDAVLAFFNDDGTHDRVAKELKVASAVTAQRSTAGKASAAKRERERQRQGNGEATGVQRDANGAVETPLDFRATPSPSPSPSVPNGTGGDIAAVIFGQGLKWLTRATGKSDTACRAQLGKWRKDVGDEALIAALGVGQREMPIDAMAFMEKAVAARKTGPARKPWEKPPADALPPEEPWAKRVSDWRKGDRWHTPQWGPEPNQPGTRVPPQYRTNRQEAAE
jgi:uncharacterized protein YdaU (DUF1376 family)